MAHCMANSWGDTGEATKVRDNGGSGLGCVRVSRKSVASCGEISRPSGSLLQLLQFVPAAAHKLHGPPPSHRFFWERQRWHAEPRAFRTCDTRSSFFSSLDNVLAPPYAAISGLDFAQHACR
eukprot:3007174-Rhodomonas_salina.1